MSTPPGALMARQIRTAHSLLERYLADFDDVTRTRQAQNLPNHAAWCIGHLALTLHVAANLFGDDQPPPESAFIAGDRGDERRFGLESVSFASVPSDDPARYPTWPRCLEILSSAVERAAAAVAKLSEEELQVEVPWGGGQSTREKIAVRQVFHLGTHCGQIADLRRALGMGSVFGKLTR